MLQSIWRLNYLFYIYKWQQKLKNEQTSEWKKRQCQIKSQRKRRKSNSLCQCEAELGSQKHISRLTETASAAETCNECGWVIARHHLPHEEKEKKGEAEMCPNIVPTVSGATLTHTLAEWHTRAVLYYPPCFTLSAFEISYYFAFKVRTFIKTKLLMPGVLGVLSTRTIINQM